MVRLTFPVIPNVLFAIPNVLFVILNEVKDLLLRHSMTLIVQISPLPLPGSSTIRPLLSISPVYSHGLSSSAGYRGY